MKKLIRAYADRAKHSIYRVVQRCLPRVRTPMGFLVRTLKAQGAWPDKARALEVFGMHGLWHTADYADHVETMDFCELDATYLRCGKRWLGRPGFRFHPGDSAETLKGLENDSYDVVVLDMPYSTGFYAEAPYGSWALLGLLKVRKPGILIVNLDNARLSGCLEQIEKLMSSEGLHFERRTVLYRNPLVSYGAWSLKGRG